MSTEKTKTIASATLRDVRRRINGRDAYYLEATAQLYQLNGNPMPHFSLTGELRDKHGESCGCLHDDILAQWPRLKPLADIHLSDSDGVPMHDIENGWYWAGGYRQWCSRGERNDPPNVQFLANHLRIPLEQAQAIVERVKAGELSKEEFRAFVESQKPRWKQEAQAALELIQSLAKERVP